jgi:hypothetical protein
VASLSRSKVDLTITIVSMVLTVFWFVFFIRRTNLYVDYLSKYSYFDSYHKKVLEQVERLGGNIEEPRQDSESPSKR